MFHKLFLSLYFPSISFLLIIPSSFNAWTLKLMKGFNEKKERKYSVRLELVQGYCPQRIRAPASQYFSLVSTFLSLFSLPIPKKCGEEKSWKGKGKPRKDWFLKRLSSQEYYNLKNQTTSR